jgi:hypothetical protein
VPGAGKVIGKFAADQPGAHDQHPGLGRLGRSHSQKTGVESCKVVQAVDRQHVFGRVARQRQANGMGAGGQHQVTVSQLTLPSAHQVLSRVNGQYLGVRQQGDLQRLGHARCWRGDQLRRAALLGKGV